MPAYRERQIVIAHVYRLRRGQRLRRSPCLRNRHGVAAGSPRMCGRDRRLDVILGNFAPRNGLIEMMEPESDQLPVPSRPVLILQQNEIARFIRPRRQPRRLQRHHSHQRVDRGTAIDDDAISRPSRSKDPGEADPRPRAPRILR
jgi:hypothetical protein